MEKKMEKKIDLSNGFEEFTQRKTLSIDQAAVTITRKGVLILNKRVTEGFLKTGEAHVKFFFNRKDKILALKLLKQAEQNSYHIKRSGPNGQLIPVRVLRYYEIDFKKSRTYAVELDEKKRVIYIDIKKLIKEIG